MFRYAEFEFACYADNHANSLAEAEVVCRKWIIKLAPLVTTKTCAAYSVRRGKLYVQSADADDFFKRLRTVTKIGDLCDLRMGPAFCSRLGGIIRIGHSIQILR